MRVVVDGDAKAEREASGQPWVEAELAYARRRVSVGEQPEKKGHEAAKMAMEKGEGVFEAGHQHVHHVPAIVGDKVLGGTGGV